MNLLHPTWTVIVDILADVEWHHRMVCKPCEVPCLVRPYRITPDTWPETPVKYTWGYSDESKMRSYSGNEHFGSIKTDQFHEEIDNYQLNINNAIKQSIITSRENQINIWKCLLIYHLGHSPITAINMNTIHTSQYIGITNRWQQNWLITMIQCSCEAWTTEY
jgi:hypothetical protein